MIHLPYFSNKYLQKSREILENATKNLDAINPWPLSTLAPGTVLMSR